MNMTFTMSEEEMVRLYLHLSSGFDALDPGMREFLNRLEKELFNSMTIAQIEAVQNRMSGDVKY